MFRGWEEEDKKTNRQFPFGNHHNTYPDSSTPPICMLTFKAAMAADEATDIEDTLLTLAR